jgi:hypothetical protein
MNHPSPKNLDMSLAWEFSEILPGTFERDRAKLAGRKFPIIGPLPDRGSDTRPKENKLASGPYIYAVYSAEAEILYVGKADEKTVLYRWIRPNGLNRNEYYWAHGTTTKDPKKLSTVEKIYNLLEAGRGPITLHFSHYQSLKENVIRKFTEQGRSTEILLSMKAMDFIKELEHCMIYQLQPEWNIQGKKKKPITVVAEHGNYWSEK